MDNENKDELKRALLEAEERERANAERARLEKERNESERTMERDRVERMEALVMQKLEEMQKLVEMERQIVEDLQALVRQRLEIIEEGRIGTLERQRMMETNQETAIGKLKSLINSWLGSLTGGVPQDDVGSFEAILAEVRKVGDNIKKVISMAAVFAVLGMSCDFVVQQGSSNFKDDDPSRLAMILHGSALCAILFGLAKLERTSWTTQLLVYLGAFVSGIATTFRFFCHFLDVGMSIGLAIFTAILLGLYVFVPYLLH